MVDASGEAEWWRRLDAPSVAIDVGLFATLMGTVLFDEVVVWFHLVFLVVTVAAFRYDVGPFLRRSVPALAIVTVVLVRDWKRDLIPFDEVLELPILSAVPALINGVAVRRARLEREVEASGQTVRRLEQARLVDQQQRQLFDLSMESTGWLTASATHDLNNILAKIQVNAETIAEDHPESAANATTQIEHAVRAAQQLVSGIAELIGSGSLDAWCNLNEVIEDSLELHAPTAPEAVDIRVELAPGGAHVHLPRVLAYQLVSNLVVNALAAMPDGGELSIRTIVRDGPPVVELTVADTGQGMSDSVRARAFDPHFTTRPLTGSGVGLYTVGRIVDGAGGSIELDTGPDAGTSFRIALPAGDAPVRSAVPVSLGDHVLVVEDEPLLRERWTASIGASGYRVTSAPNAPAALLRILDEGHVPDLLLTDFGMPGMDGLEFVEALRREAPGLPVVLVSGSLPELPVGWRDDPRNVFVPKPCSTSELVAVIERLLARPSEVTAQPLLDR